MRACTTKSVSVLFLILIGIANALAQRNLSFEDVIDSAKTKPTYWFAGGKGYDVVIDSSIAQHGTRSLRMSRKEPGSFGVSTQTIPADSFAGSFVVLNAWIKTEAVSDGYSGLWLRLDGANNKMLYLDNMNDRGVKGSTSWTRYEIRTLVSLEVHRLAFGALLTGNGTSWFDTFELWRVVAEELPPTSTEALSYLNQSLDIMERNSIKRDSVDWKAIRSTIINHSRGAQQTKDTYPHIRHALKILGDNHSFLMTPEQSQAWKAGGNRSGMNQEIDFELIQRRFAYISVPAFSSGSDSAIRRFASQIQKAIANLDTLNPCGWIVDLRDNGGGNMWPMIAGLGPLLGDGQLGAFVGPRGNRKSWWYQKGKSGSGAVALANITGDGYKLRNPRAPIAVLTGTNTASSGEAVVTSFRGRPNTRSFGKPTRGLSTSNENFPLTDGAMMLLTTSVFADRSGRTYGDVIEPDELVETEASRFRLSDYVLQAALTWLSEQPSCNKK